MPYQLTPPEITPEMRASARANPSTWLYVIDPAFDEDADIPPWGVVGAYPVNADGEIDATFRRNTAYRPSPSTLRTPQEPRQPQPVGDLERALELIQAGRQDQSILPAAVLRAELLLYAASPADRSVTGFPARDGTVMVPACTSVAHVPAVWPGWRQVSGRDLVPLLHGHPLVINPAGPVTAMIPAAHLRSASG